MRGRRLCMDVDVPGAVMMIFDGFFDDAALFPPGDASMQLAVRAHRGHRSSPRARYTGPFVVAVTRVEELVAARSTLGDHDPLRIAVTLGNHSAAIEPALAAADHAQGLQVAAVEFSLPPDLAVSDAMAAISAAAIPDEVAVFVEVPRDERRDRLIDALSGTALYAKLRTGGIYAGAYPDENELATTIHRAVTRDVAFKATAGLHHAIRNTDPHTGFEQHGFLNILVAVAAASDGAKPSDLRDILQRREPTGLATSVAALDPQSIPGIRGRFRSLGTCSILEPLADLVGLGLLGEHALATSSENA